MHNITKRNMIGIERKTETHNIMNKKITIGSRETIMNIKGTLCLYKIVIWAVLVAMKNDIFIYKRITYALCLCTWCL